MSWEFEHWDNGKVYLHLERWEAFRKNVEKYGYEGYLHDWNHNRIFCNLHTPRENLLDVPAEGDEGYKHKISHVSDYRVIFQPFPAFVRTGHDPEAWLESWNIWAEDQGEGEPLSILTTVEKWKPQKDDGFIYIRMGAIRDVNTFASFRGMFWLVDALHYYGIGPNPPPPKKKKKVLAPRSIFDPQEAPW